MANSEHNINLCRICLREIVQHHGTNLFLDHEKSKEILHKITTCCKIILMYDANFPSNICGNCIADLNVAHEFRLKILTFEERYAVLFGQTKTTSKQCNGDISNQQKYTFENKSEFYKVTEYDGVITPDSKISQIKSENLQLNCQLPYYRSINYKAQHNLVLQCQISDDKSPSVEVDNKNLKCNICGKFCKSDLALKQHLAGKHKISKHVGRVVGHGVSRRYHCTSCEYSTPHSQTLVNHMRRHNGVKPYICDCGQSFAQASTLVAHRKIHSSTSTFTCEVCGKQFKHSFSLKRHMLVHDSGCYTCNICQKIVKSKYTLQDHMLRHNNIHNYNCEDCGDTFVTSSELINHKKKHTLVKKVECHLCSYKTHSKKSFSIHLKRHTCNKAFKCKECEMCFYTASDARRHARVHTREKPYECSACAQRFAHSPSLSKHVRRVHDLNYKWDDLSSRNSSKISKTNE